MDGSPNVRDQGESGTVPTNVIHQHGGDKYASDGHKKPDTRNTNKRTCTWNLITLRTVGKLEMSRCYLDILVLCHVHWEN